MPRKAKVEAISFQEKMDKLNETYGKGTVITLDTDKVEEYNVIPSGSIGVDHVALGVGGFIKGKMYELRGWEGTGKSTLAGTLCANCQKLGGKVLYIDGEHAVDIKYFQKLGVDLSKFILCQPDYGEEGFDVAETLINTGELSLVIIDSDSSLIPKIIIDNPMEASNLGKKAKLNSTAYPRLKLSLSNNNCCVIVISQYREKIGVMFGDPKVTSGGHALKFYADIIIELSKKLSKEGDETVGNDTKFKTIKNKTYPPFKECRFDIVFGKGIDRAKEVLELAIELGIITKSGASYSLGEQKLERGEAKMIQFMEDNPEFREDIELQVINTIHEKPKVEDNAEDVPELG